MNVQWWAGGMLVLSALSALVGLHEDEVKMLR